MRLFISVLVFLSVLTTAVYAQDFMNITADPGDSFNAVLVEKSTDTLHILKVTGDKVTELKNFSVITGRVNGDKESRGDEKTPEGLYFVTGFLSPAKLHEMYGDVAKQYGTGAYPLSYPNLKDRLFGKTGGGIWLHGMDPKRTDDVTKGCVAFANSNVQLISKYIKAGTPVLITEKAMEGTPVQVAEHFKKMRGLVMGYIKAWQTSDFDSFKKFYHSSFKSVGGRNFASYLAYKNTLMKLYPYRKVDAEDFRIFTQDDAESVVEFNQFYCAPNVISYGRKRFYMERGLDGGLKIVTEEFAPMNSTEYVRKKVNEFLIGWKNSWESLKIGDYMSHYSDKFSSKGMNKTAWQSDKSGKFAKLTHVNVSIDNISYKVESPIKYVVEFRQVYKGDNYSDRGIKTLELSGCPGDFKIVAENWRAE